MSQNDARRTARQTAIKWFVTLQEADIEHPQRSQFEQWLLMHPLHQQAYQEVCTLWESLDSSDQLTHLESAMQQKIFIEETSRRKKIRNIITHTLSAIFIVAIGLGSYIGYDTWQQQPSMHLLASTDIGDMRTQILEDGTRLVVNANSEVEVTYTRGKRLVLLKRGEVSFDVTKNPDRPFVVDSGLARITVLGTRFAVNKFNSKVRISVDHGTVRVEPTQYDVSDNDSKSRYAEHVLTLRDNEVAEISILGTSQRVARPAADAFGFEKGIIAFDQADLEEITETLSRYRQPLVTARQAPDKNIKVTAVVQTQHVERFLRQLPVISPLSVQYADDQTILIAP